MRFLIVAKFWDSSAGIGALRPMKIAKHLLEEGHDVAVICGKEFTEDKISTNINLKHGSYQQLPVFTYSGLVAKEDAFYRKRNNSSTIQPANYAKSTKKETKKAKKQSAFNKLKWTVYKTIYNSVKVNNTVACAMRAIKGQLPWKPDVIFSSFAPEEVHFLAMKLKRLYPQACWVADFRDPMANRLSQTKAEYRYKLHRQKLILKKANAVTVVSKTWRDEFRKQGAKNAIALYSGFDKTDFHFDDQHKDADAKLTFTYTGSLYPGLSDLGPFFKALGELIEERAVDPERIRIVYAGAHAEEFSKQTAGLPDAVEIANHGLVSRDESLRLLTQSDILLHALFCYPETRGIITGKLGEYWASMKPIIAIITGTARADEFISILEESGTGFCYDETEHGASFNRLKDYIKEQYLKKESNKPLVYLRKESFVERFDYKGIAKQLVEITTQMIEKGRE